MKQIKQMEKPSKMCEFSKCKCGLVCRLMSAFHIGVPWYIKLALEVRYTSPNDIACLEANVPKSKPLIKDQQQKLLNIMECEGL